MRETREDPWTDQNLIGGKNEYPELTEEEIVDIFEAFGEEYEGDLLAEQEATAYTDYLKLSKTGLMGILQEYPRSRRLINTRKDD